jgi:hypothetical protein
MHAARGCPRGEPQAVANVLLQLAWPCGPGTTHWHRALSAWTSHAAVPGGRDSNRGEFNEHASAVGAQRRAGAGLAVEAAGHLPVSEQWLRGVHQVRVGNRRFLGPFAWVYSFRGLCHSSGLDSAGVWLLSYVSKWGHWHCAGRPPFF